MKSILILLLVSISFLACSQSEYEFRKKGRELLKEQKFDLAIVELNKAIAINPTYDTAYFTLGDCYYALNQLPEAKSNYEKCLALNPEYAKVYIAISAIISDNDSCIYYLNKALQFAKEDNIKWLAEVQLASRLRYSNRFSEAIEHYTIGNEIKKLNNGLLSDWAYCEYKNNDYKSAEEHYKVLINIDSNNPDYPLLLGNIFAKQEDFPKAIEYYKISVDKAPSSSQVLFNLGEAYFKNKEYKNALKVLLRSDSLAPETPRILLSLSNVYYKLDNSEKACNLLERVIHKLEKQGYEYNIKKIEKSKEIEVIKLLEDTCNLSEDNNTWVYLEAINNQRKYCITNVRVN